MTRNKILMGVDPFSEEVGLIERQGAALNAMFRNQDYSVEPLYVITPRMMSWSDLLVQETWNAYETSIKETIQDRLRAANLPPDRLLPPTVLMGISASIRGDVATLLEYARKSGADFIAVSSHSRQGLKRAFLGSFAETLANRTDIPLLVINPRQRFQPHQFRRVLFPTDLSAGSKAGLERLCAAMGGVWKSIVLFHQVESFSYLTPPFVSIPLPPSAFEEDWRGRENTLSQWVGELEEKGFEAVYKFSRRSSPLAETIQSVAKIYKAGMIAMVSESGPVEAALLGATTRKVMRASNVPVWVIHVSSSQQLKPEETGGKQAA